MEQLSHSAPGFKVKTKSWEPQGAVQTSKTPASVITAPHPVYSMGVQSTTTPAKKKIVFPPPGALLRIKETMVQSDSLISVFFLKKD